MTLALNNRRQGILWIKRTLVGHINANAPNSQPHKNAVLNFIFKLKYEPYTLSIEVRDAILMSTLKHGKFTL